MKHRFKIVISIIMSLFLLTGFTPTSIAASETKVSNQYGPDLKDYDIKEIAITMGEPNFSVNYAFHELEDGLYTKAILQDDIILAPLGDIMLSIGGTHNVAGNGKITISVNNKVVELSVGETTAYVNGTVIELEAAPFYEEGSLFLPFKSVMEALGGKVSWKKDTQTISAFMIFPITDDTIVLEKGGEVPFNSLLKKSEDWYGSKEAKLAADNILGFQNDDGGWMKVEPDVSMLQTIGGAGILNVTPDSTIDNDATLTQIRYLAKVYNKTQINAYKESFNKGIQYLLNGQYENGGWPQFFPNAVGYKEHVTFNDNAMANILDLFRDILTEDGFELVDDNMRGKIKKSFDKGMQCILDAQIVVNGVKTAWCAQHDKDTLEPIMGRSYELASISGSESVKILNFLMSLDNPSPEIIEAIDAGVKWFDDVKIEGYKMINKPDYALPLGRDRVLVEDEDSVIWARFYEIGTNVPMFSSRDSVVKYDMADISYERRNKYSWYGAYAKDLLATTYPEWQAKWNLPKK